MFSGSTKGNRSRVHGGHSSHVEALSTVATHDLSASRIDTKGITATDAVVDSLDATTLSIASALSVPQVVVNGGSDEISIVTSVDTTVGASGVVLASGSTPSTSQSANGISIGSGNTIGASSDSSIIIGESSTSDANNNIVIGQGVVNGQAHGVLIGFGTVTNGGDSNVAIGRGASSVGSAGIAVGYGSSVDNDDGVAIGTNADVSGFSRGVAIGLNASVTGGSAIALGPNAASLGTNSVSIGTGSGATGSNCVTMGGGASCGNVIGAVAIGTGALGSGAASVTMGYNAGSSGVGVAIGGAASTENGVSIGSSAVSAGTGVAVGGSAIATHDGSVALGPGVVSRADDEFACAGMRVYRRVGRTNATTGATILFPIEDGESVMFDVVAVGNHDGAANPGDEVVVLTFKNYLGRRVGSLTHVHGGVDSVTDHAGLGCAGLIAEFGSAFHIQLNPSGNVMTWNISCTVYGVSNPVAVLGADWTNYIP